MLALLCFHSSHIKTLFMCLFFILDSSKHKLPKISQFYPFIYNLLKADALLCLLVVNVGPPGGLIVGIERQSQGLIGLISQRCVFLAK